MKLKQMLHSCAPWSPDMTGLASHTWAASLFLLWVRLYWGWQFAQTGAGKLGNLEGVEQFFTSLGIPLPELMAVWVGVLESLGGTLLAVGALSRPVALMLTANMAVAFWTADRPALLSIVSAPDQFIAAAPFSFLLASLVVLLFGSGKLSVDFGLAALMARRRQEAEGPQQEATAATMPS